MSYVEYFLNSSSSIIRFETIELAHANFTRSYWLVRNKTDGLTATLETMASQAFEYCPMRIKPANEENNLDFGIEVEIGDVGEILPLEMDSILQADGFLQKPTLRYRIFRSDDLTQPLLGPLEMQIDEIAFNKQGAKFTANANRLSLSQTGRAYTFEDIPMLRAFL